MHDNLFAVLKGLCKLGKHDKKLNRLPFDSISIRVSRLMGEVSIK